MNLAIQLLLILSLLDLSRIFCFGFIIGPRIEAGRYPDTFSQLHIGDGSDTQHTSYFQPTNISIQDVYVAHVETLRDRFPSYECREGADGSNGATLNFNERRQRGTNGEQEKECDIDDEYCNLDSHVANLQFQELVGDDEVVLVDTVLKGGMDSVSRAFCRAGPKRHLHFDPSKVNAAILSAGGLCCGVNNVIRELVHSLYYLYGANKVYGIQGGFHGFHDPNCPPILLTTDMVENIHHEGGTILGSSRGGFDIEKIFDFVEKHSINQLFIIGGDGTHRGAYAIHKACMERGVELAVVGIPKTIDNDIDYIDRSFGFQTACEAAQLAIHSAKTEAKCNFPNGIGICKLMGRYSGFLAAFAALGSQDVDLVLVPEVPIILEGPQGILPFLRKRIKEQKYVVVVVAEGAGEEILGVSDVLDAGGNRALPEIGPYLQKVLKEYFSKFGETTTIKYIDPSYTVRTVPANGADSLYCQQLAMDAVHAAMAGFTGFSIGLVNKQNVLIPIPQLVATSPRHLDPLGSTWERILAMTGQPSSISKNAKSTGTPTDASTILPKSSGELIVMESGLPEPSAH
ncbi:6-phosphofructokinase [Nitzschia inconspicua]|uniref:6-phosphofructokinase n=1 Tax=Nitzschia inconspicua TaxID=303405 RepID=A0A9K3KQT2_9STRA|nr:6-phosphofructokinase [Nitzschia inconspicua]